MNTFEQVKEVIGALDELDIEAMWYLDDGEVRAALNVNDVFAWGCADAENVEPLDLELLDSAHRDLEATGLSGAAHWAACLYTARKRRMRPQGAFYEKCLPEKTWALFNSCGPHRLSGVGNPVATPNAELSGERSESAPTLCSASDGGDK